MRLERDWMQHVHVAVGLTGSLRDGTGGWTARVTRLVQTRQETTTTPLLVPGWPAANVGYHDKKEDTSCFRRSSNIDEESRVLHVHVHTISNRETDVDTTTPSIYAPSQPIFTPDNRDHDS